MQLNNYQHWVQTVHVIEVQYFSIHYLTIIKNFINQQGQSKSSLAHQTTSFKITFALNPCITILFK